jgi:hypothetical protein
LRIRANLRERPPASRGNPQADDFDSMPAGDHALTAFDGGLPRTPLVASGGVLVFGAELVRLFLRIRHIRNVERLASFRQRDPRIPQAYIMFALLGIVCFLRQRGAPGRRFPCGLALGSHLVLSISTTSPPASTILLPLRIYCELVSLTFRRGRNDRGARLP